MRIFIAIFCGLVSLGCLLAGLSELADTTPTDRAVSLGIWLMQAFVYAVIACYWARPLEKWNAAMVCSSCGQRGTLLEEQLGRPRPSFWAFVAGGIVLTLVAQHARVRRFYCQQCSAHTWQRTVGSWVALAWVVMVVLIIAAQLFLAA